MLCWIYESGSYISYPKPSPPSPGAPSSVLPLTPPPSQRCLDSTVPSSWLTSFHVVVSLLGILSPTRFSGSLLRLQNESTCRFLCAAFPDLPLCLILYPERKLFASLFCFCGSGQGLLRTIVTYGSACPYMSVSPSTR